MNPHYDLNMASKQKWTQSNVIFQCCLQWPKVQTNISSVISFRASPSSQGLGAIEPGIAPQGNVSVRSSSGVAGISQQHTALLLVLMPFLLTLLTLLEILQKPQILPWTIDAPQIFRFASTSWPPLSGFDLPSLAPQPPEGVSAGWRGFQGASRGLSILHPGLSVQRPWPVILLLTHTHTHLYTLV